MPGLAHLWPLDPAVVFLNHGSFGASPRAVLDYQQALRDRLERQPVAFLGRELEDRLAGARVALGAFIGADADDLAFLRNATSGVNAVLRSLTFAPGDEIVATDHAYGGSRNALDFVAARTGVRVTIARVPFPLASANEVIAAVLERLTSRTRLALVDHVTSPTGLVFPLARLVPALAERGVDALVDGAHAPGMLPLDLHALGAAYYAGNCHKWLCAPKGAAFLHVRADRQSAIHPLTISHGLTSPRTDRSRFRLEFDWMGTDDPTAWLTVPEAIRIVGGLVDGGWPQVMAENRALALDARDILCKALGVAPPVPDDMIGSLAAVPLPDAPPGEPAPLPGGGALQVTLRERHGIEVPIISWPAWPRRLVRISAQLYNDRAQYALLADALVEEESRK